MSGRVFDRMSGCWQKAVTLDNEKEHEKALSYYRRAADYIQQLRISQKSIRILEMLDQRADLVHERIRVLTQVVSRKRQVGGSPGPVLSTQPTTPIAPDSFGAALGGSHRNGWRGNVNGLGGTGTGGGCSPSGGSGGTDTRIDARKQNLSALFDKSKTDVRLDDVVGLDEAKQAIRESIEFPLRFSKLRQHWTCVLLYGPPGTGKTLLAQAVANEFQAKFLAVSSADLMSQWQGESEKYVKALFELAQDNAPCIIFIDEIDSVCSTRADREPDSIRRVKTQFLIQMNQLEKSDKLVLVLGATNIPWDLDSACLRRFQKRVYVGLPDLDARRDLFMAGLKQERHLLGSGDFEELARRSEGLSASDIAIVCSDATTEPYRTAFNARHFKSILGSDGRQKFYPLADPAIRCRWPDCDCKDGTRLEETAIPLAFNHLDEKDMELPPVQWADVFKALSKVKRAVSDDDIAKFENWERTTLFLS
ncbi:putative vacuolar sorting ATPase [Gregarina niphandrodes]|uniref:Vacuolar sorting ATPase n=1 Tax=Gregarina niphandrodes TaxID=110365 RepID=A0A023B218_GRENI|nr:putative vacuolar sorting ATPase [Gregarina niphandrodes]EZG47687.1 putative vacuolar sorting ATPase [Gregarina niphandrodes]|eukprot:XP_011132153.1 putative vacuolar sorting ATPase [Gregarina niphandrodes]